MTSQPNSGQLTLAAIGMGSNLGNREATLLAAWHDLSRQPGIHTLQLSSPYLSTPFEMDSSQDFVNAVGLVETVLAPLALLHTLQDMEARHGRRRDPSKKGYQDRSLDLDLLFWNGLCLESDELTLPHPRLHERLFALAPLAELLPLWQHPLAHSSASTLLARLNAQKNQHVQRGVWNRDPGLERS